MTSRSIPSAFVKNVLQNGVGRYVCQLQRLTICFCKSRPDSRGTREFIEKHVLDFTRDNPGVVVYLKPRRHQVSKLVAEYLNGNTKSISITKMAPEDICKWVEHLRTRSGPEIVRLRKMWHTENPSIQGVWSPFTNKDTKLNVTQLPCSELSKMGEESSATTRIIAMAKTLNLKDKNVIKEN